MNTVGKDVLLDQQCAENPQTHPDTLAVLWKYYVCASYNTSILQRVLRNPNVDLQAIYEAMVSQNPIYAIEVNGVLLNQVNEETSINLCVYEGWAQDLFQNPSWTLWWMENPDFLETLSNTDHDTFYREVEDQQFLASQIQRRQSWIDERISSNPHASSDMLLSILQQGNIDIEEIYDEHIKYHPNFPSQWRDEIEKAIQRQPLDATTLQKWLSLDEEKGGWLTSLVLRNPAVPEDMYRRYWDKAKILCSQLRKYLQDHDDDSANNVEIHAGVLQLQGILLGDHITYDEIESILPQIEEISTLHQRLQSMYQQEQARKIANILVKALMQNPHTPLDFLYYIAQSSDDYGWYCEDAMSRNPLSDVVIERALEKDPRSVERASCLFLSLTQSTNEQTRMQANQNRYILDTHRQMLDKLLQFYETPTKNIRFSDEEWDFFYMFQQINAHTAKLTWSSCAMAMHPQVPLALLQNLVDENQYAVKYDIAKNPVTPKSILQKLADKNYDSATTYYDETLEELLLFHPTTTENDVTETYRKKEQDQNKKKYWRKLISTHPHVSTEILRELSNDEDIAVRGAVALHEKTDTATLLRLSYDAQPHVIGSAARHPTLPIERVYALLQHQYAYIRAASFSQRRIPSNILENALEQRKYGEERPGSAKKDDDMIAILGNWRLQQSILHRVWYQLQKYRRGDGEGKNWERLYWRSLDFSVASNLTAPDAILQEIQERAEQKNDDQILLAVQTTRKIQSMNFVSALTHHSQDSRNPQTPRHFTKYAREIYDICIEYLDKNSNKHRDKHSNKHNNTEKELQ